MTSPESEQPQPDSNQNQPKLTLDALKAGLPEVEAEKEPDTKDILEDRSVQLSKQKEEIQNLRSNRELKVKYSRNSFRYLWGYSFGVAGLLVLDGFGVKGFDLHTHILVALVGSTAVSAIGLVALVGKGLFIKST